MGEGIILGIESSCDETAAAIVAGGREILSSVIHSQIDIHRLFGGVVPEVASRKHIQNIVPVLEQALVEANVSYRDIDAVAVTNRPGLIGALLVGLSFAKAFAYGLNKPLIGVNHLRGHIYANFLTYPDIEFPAVCLVVSGGHTSLLYMRSLMHTELIGQTEDDAAGEAFDKVARFMGLGYPGGPRLQKAAEQGRPGCCHLPRVYLDRPHFDFSFSGLKTATMNQWNKMQRAGEGSVNDLAAEFQAAVAEILVEKTMRAAAHYDVPSVLMAGGVAANAALRERLERRCGEDGRRSYYPPLSLCTDNAAMIAGLAWHDFAAGRFDGLELNAKAFLS
ncbi:MAG: tRNA (adenosine(37)-N6)-threonylcarbamoyltransferase complex transferase subunit TsaD [Syntrophomonadaceae bacterium]|nr:tRNA (adenosine(37)-N6)-threonylcarbamoyltransferase complex transferase subunit TsaD [Syntrophomonadaceae bacterium]